MTFKTAKQGLHALLHELSDDEADATEASSDTLDDPKRPWSPHFWAYINTLEQVPDGWSAIKWWGVSAPSNALYSVPCSLSCQVNSSRFHPAWASLTCDYLSIMSSSVSSEHAFSQGGITISKQWNRLKGDVVEMLQCMKCAIRHDLLFHEPAPSSTLELESDDDGEDDSNGRDDGWDELWGDGGIRAPMTVGTNTDKDMRFDSD